MSVCEPALAIRLDVMNSLLVLVHMTVREFVYLSEQLRETCAVGFWHVYF